MNKESGHDSKGSSKRPKTGRFKDTSRRLRQGKEGHLRHRASLDWRQDRHVVCAPAGDEDACILSLEALKESLVSSRTGAALLEDASRRGLQIHYDSQTPLAQFYPREDACVLTLNPNHPRGELLVVLARELRRAWQYYRGALDNPMRYEPDDAILVNRAQQADAFITAIKVAWEMKLQGDAEAWNFMVYCSAAPSTQEFERRAREDFRSLNNGEAARAAYDRFFEGNSTRLHDKRIIHQMLLDDSGYMKAPGKQPRVGVELLQRLGEMPHGCNYLSSRAGHRSPTDMCYSTVEDRSNANFLWFIKFERSFQEKELKMLQESVRASAEIVDFAAWALSARRSPKH